MSSFGCDAILFDLDGVLVDSTVAVERAWRVWADKHGLDEERFLEIAHGRRTAETIRLVAPDLDADSEARDLERIEAGDLEGVLEVEGAHALLSSLPRDCWTVVTSGTRLLATRRMEHFGLPLPERFISADDVTNGKPHPKAYLKGAEILGVSPETRVVVEDAPSGVKSAKSAGMRVLAVATTYHEDDLSEADEVAPSLAGIRAVSTPQARTRLEVRAAG
ncbi:MAG: HAD family hydrolase [Rubrobacteraceae bacterium]